MEAADAAEAAAADAAAAEPGAAQLLGRSPYGFNQQYTGVFTHVMDDAAEVLHIPNPERMPPAERRGA